MRYLFVPGWIAGLVLVSSVSAVPAEDRVLRFGSIPQGATLTQTWTRSFDVTIQVVAGEREQKVEQKLKWNGKKTVRFLKPETLLVTYETISEPEPDIRKTKRVVSNSYLVTKGGVLDPLTRATPNAFEVALVARNRTFLEPNPLVVILQQAGAVSGKTVKVSKERHKGLMRWMGDLPTADFNGFSLRLEKVEDDQAIFDIVQKHVGSMKSLQVEITTELKGQLQVALVGGHPQLLQLKGPVRGFVEREVNGTRVKVVVDGTDEVRVTSVVSE